MPGRKRVPSFQLPSGTTAERDNSYNLTTVGNIFYNTDTSNVEIRHVDPSNSLAWRDLVVNNRVDMDISGVNKITFADGESMITAAPIVKEYICSYCDGTQNLGYWNTLNLNDVTAPQNLVYGFDDVTGSNVSYRPPRGTKKVIYSFQFQVSRGGTNAGIGAFKFEIKDTNSNWQEVEWSYRAYSAVYLENGAGIMKVPIEITGDSDDDTVTNLKNGKMGTWNTNKEMRVRASESYSTSSSDQIRIHETEWWHGGTSDGRFCKPTLTIIALG